MATFLQRLLGRAQTADARELAELQLRLLVAMADADARINLVETDEIVGFIDRVARTTRDREHLHHLLDDLLSAPQPLDQLLDELSGHADSARVGTRLVHELANVAASDDEIDHREEFLLDMVCDVFGLPPIPLHQPDAELGELHGFVHRLAETSRHA